MGKIYKGVWGCISRLTHIGGGGDHGTGMEGGFSTSLIYGGDGGGRCASSIGRG